jgi:hypothetical protein
LPLGHLFYSGGNNMVDPVIEKALRMQRKTECFSTITILKAALWLEVKYRETPYYDTAVTLSLQYSC